MQMNNIRRQGELSKKISRNNAEISAGIMDSWNRRSNAFDHMSSNYSQAVRGVNSYTVLYGNTVECDVRADYVYENQYGDIFGVSGNEIDKYIALMLNWTKLRKK